MTWAQHAIGRLIVVCWPGWKPLRGPSRGYVHCVFGYGRDQNPQTICTPALCVLAVQVLSYGGWLPGSPDVSDKAKFDALIDAVLATRKHCIGNNDNATRAERIECCKAHSPGPSAWYLSGICAKPWLLELSQKSTTDLTEVEKMDLFSSVLGDFIGVSKPDGYLDANPEFWCKNCPNDKRKNCPFDPPAGSAREDLCECPGGRISTESEPFWAMVTDHSLAADFVRCDDKARVYRAWVAALFPEWQSLYLDYVERTFARKCVLSKAPIGYILSLGPVLALLATIFFALSLPKFCANSPMSGVAFNVAMLGIALAIVGVWPLEWSGASDLLARYALCSGRGTPVVLNELGRTPEGFIAGPTLYNHIPCSDLNSRGEEASNPFVSFLNYAHAGYLSGGTLAVLSLLALIAVRPSRRLRALLPTAVPRPASCAAGRAASQELAPSQRRP
jgi:hypothetical protein